MLRNAFTMTLLLFLGSCTGGSNQNDEATRFSGLWEVTGEFGEPAYLRFNSSGQVEHVVSGCEFTGLGCSDFVDAETTDGRFACPLEGSWTALSDQRLLVHSTCSDETTRDLEFLFEGDASGNRAGTSVRLVAVESLQVPGTLIEIGISGFQWEFRKCQQLSVDACQ